MLDTGGIRCRWVTCCRRQDAGYVVYADACVAAAEDATLLAYVAIDDEDDDVVDVVAVAVADAVDVGDDVDVGDAVDVADAADDADAADVADAADGVDVVDAVGEHAIGDEVSECEVVNAADG